MKQNLFISMYCDKQRPTPIPKIKLLMERLSKSNQKAKKLNNEMVAIDIIGFPIIGLPNIRCIFFHEKFLFF